MELEDTNSTACMIYIPQDRKDICILFNVHPSVDLQGQGHSDTIVNVEEFCFDALPPTYKQCDFAILED